MNEPRDVIGSIADETRERFQATKAILSFEGWLRLLQTRPYELTRNAAQYAADMMDHFGVEEVDGIGGKVRRFKIFDDEGRGGDGKVVGQEEVQNEVYRCLNEFVQRRQIDRMILLHGPNGSSKTTFVAALVRGLERYSETEEGMRFRFNWVFSESDERGERLGFDPVRPDERLDTFAFLEPDRISAKIPCEMNETPFFLLPREHRRRVLDEALAGADEATRARFVWTRHLRDGDLSPKSRRIHDALFNAYKGDWRKVMRHVQVERYRFSKLYRTGAVTIEPQANIDASSRQIGHASVKGLPPILQNESLFEALGDLVDANGGIVEYSDFFKRTLEANKYLLTTAENGTISLSSYVAAIDLVLIGTSNENYLTAFRRDPIFSSFKARLEFVRVPYLLSYSKEAEIYDRQLEKLEGRVQVAPHTTRTAALWAVLTRLVEPRTAVKEDRLRRIIEKITPIQKARLYDHGAMPRGLTDEEKSLLRAHVKTMRHEHDDDEAEFEGVWDAAYEGRRGCSVREMGALFSAVAVDPPGGCITPLLILRRLPDLLKETTIHDFLRIEPTRLHYHDAARFVEDVREAYFEWLRGDVLRAADLVEESEYGRLLRDYFRHVKAFTTKEKVRDESTGRSTEPDEELMRRIERLTDIEQSPVAFRSALMTRMAAWRLENPSEVLQFESVFSELFQRLRENFFRERIEKVRRLIEDALILERVRPGKLDEEHRADARRFLDRMQEEQGYPHFALVEALPLLLDRLEA